MESALPGVVEPHIRRHFVQHFHCCGAGFHGEGRQQQVIADGVDQSRDSLRTKVNLLDQFRGDHLLVFDAGARHARIHVSDGFLETESAQRAAQCDALLELAEFRRFQLAIELLLTCEYDLEHLPAPVLEVAEEADLFQHVPLEVVRLIYDHHGGPPGGGAFQQQVVE